MHLSELKAIHVSELIKMGEALEIENVARMRKQELMFAIMKKRAALPMEQPPRRGPERPVLRVGSANTPAFP